MFTVTAQTLYTDILGIFWMLRVISWQRSPRVTYSSPPLYVLIEGIGPIVMDFVKRLVSYANRSCF